MANTLLPPSVYLPWLEKIRKTHSYAKRWAITLERHTNAHPECSGHSWGWYEVHPNRVVVGYWGSDKDDLEGVDIAAWNSEALRISAPQR